ncbi:hypothetical protein HNQ65_003409 [Prosthecobacter vanneervenii]|uniref:Uncharacterized protein n=1 Tax=Prosthecobacter vanneervenii TaxID=48466 RepID=A0A7W7YCZ4_9BACT|nr:hypothetical protein [Prosthecobacter vanneervenii]
MLDAPAESTSTVSNGLLLDFQACTNTFRHVLRC